MMSGRKLANKQTCSVGIDSNVECYCTVDAGHILQSNISSELKKSMVLYASYEWCSIISSFVTALFLKIASN